MSRPERSSTEPREQDEPAIRVDGLTKAYDGPAGKIRAVDDVSFSVDPGTVVGVLGPNGAGKTTMIKSMLGLIVPTAGEVRLAGVDVHAHPSKAYEHVGAMLEGARNVYWRLTVRENLDFFASLAGHPLSAVRERHDELLATFGLAEKADETVNELSRGMKQKVSLASTLSRGASVLFLDEPTLGLDVESSLELRRELRGLVDRESMTVVLSSHDMDVIEELCDRVMIMNDGRVIADDTVENLTGVFASQAYELTMAGRLPETTRTQIEREHTVERWERTPDGVDRFEVVLEDGDALYDLTNTLEGSRVTIASIDAIQPDLESVFLELTNRAGSFADSRSRAPDDERRADRDGSEPQKREARLRRDGGRSDTSPDGERRGGGRR